MLFYKWQEGEEVEYGLFFRRHGKLMFGIVSAPVEISKYKDMQDVRHLMHISKQEEIIFDNGEV